MYQFLTMEINGEVDAELTAHIDFPVSYDDPFEIYKAIKLTQGKNILKIKANGGNLDKIEIMKGPFEYEGAPFFDTPYIVPAIGELVIEAEHFDRGGREIAFHDNTTNGGNDVSKSVRGEEDGSANVEMEYRNPQGGTNATIGWANEGEWLTYSINVEEEGEYDIFYVLSTNNGDRKQHIEVDGVAYPEIIAHTPGDWLTWMDILVGSKVELTTGIHTLYAYYYGNFDKIKIRKHSDIFPYEHNPQAIPGTIQAWKFDEGGESLTYGVSDKTLGEANNAIRENVAVPIRGSEDDYYVDVVESGTPSWLLYTVDIKETGYYKLTFKVASNIGDESFTLSNRFWSAKAAFPEASSSEWQDITFPIVKLNEGLDTLKLTTSGSGAKIASIKFEPVTDVIDRSNWTVEVSDEKPSDGGGKDTMFDDNFTTFWHSNYPLSENPDADLPHWAIIDLGYPVEISQIITIRRSNGDIKSLQYSVSNDPNSDVWTIIAEGEYAAQSDGIHNLTLDATQIVKARYLKLFLPDSYRDIFTGIAEVYAIGKEYQGIKHVEALPGKVYAENGILKVKEFPTSASLAVYNILGQKITAYKAVNDGVEIKLPSKGIYVVKVQNKGITSSYKVVVK
ncbi:hypothetical protein FACS1894123_11200 [Bacteroidia bacterium]|nr:hypothetical protein FACS1894123_11200 [Bacteroidia bacterium]